MAQFHVRWLIRRDVPEVLGISPDLTEDTLAALMRERNVIGMVAEEEDRVVGYMIYELHKTRLDVVRFAVQQSKRCQGVGETMLGKLVSKLSSHRRSRARFEVSEWNDDAIAFLKRVGAEAVRVIRGVGDESDTYRFVVRANEAADACGS